jgi:hypothetical protein
MQSVREAACLATPAAPTPGRHGRAPYSTSEPPLGAAEMPRGYYLDHDAKPSVPAAVATSSAGYGWPKSQLAKIPVAVWEFVRKLCLTRGTSTERTDTRSA